MKKILAAILCILLCMVMLCSCKDKVLDEFATKVAKAEASSAQVDITYTIHPGEEDETKMTSSGTLYSEDSRDTSEWKAPYFTMVTTNAKGEVVLPDSTTAEADAATKLSTKIESITFSKLNFDKRFFQDKKYSLTEDKFYAIVTDVGSFFGIETDIAKADVIISLRSDGSPKKMTITYTTAMECEVKIVMVYSY
ncbi:MAG: hypothetical protein ACI3XE_03830 [Eubacteriales bacterium]